MRSISSQIYTNIVIILFSQVFIYIFPKRIVARLQSKGLRFKFRARIVVNKITWQDKQEHWHRLYKHIAL